MDVLIPKIGLTIESVEVLVWHKAVGDQIAEGELIAEVGADKANLEIVAPEAGVLTEIRFQGRGNRAHRGDPRRRRLPGRACRRDDAGHRAVDDRGDLLSAVILDVSSRDTTSMIVGAVEAVARARAREAPMAAPSFAVSNLGMFGVEQFTPIITPPQVAVLGVGAIVDGRTHLSLTFDHRAVDGAPAARFLSDVCERLASFDGG